jgi:hypothetical protein
METERHTREDRATDRSVDEAGLSRTAIAAITVPCGVAGIASGIALGSAVASPATVAYLAAALFVAVLAFAVR